MQKRKAHHRQHAGELEVQKRRNVPPSTTLMLQRMVTEEMPAAQVQLYSELSYIAVSSEDSQGRPWATILCGPPGEVVTVTAPNCLLVSCALAAEDPFVKCLEAASGGSMAQPLMCAGLGVDFSNRRRYRVSGVIAQASIMLAAQPECRRVEMKFITNENIGNCSKYITVRDVRHAPRVPEVDQSTLGNQPVSGLLGQRCQAVIEKASTVFLATKHVDDGSGKSCSDAGLNHRGGPPGFVRTYDDGEHSYVVLPDYSGNRFYQSLGNVQTDRVAGVVFPDFSTGDMLHVTGVAENIFDDEARMLMPRMSLVTRIRITGHVLLRRSLQLEMVSKEQLSPYNPPVRYLASELEAMGNGTVQTAAGGGLGKARLVAITQNSSRIRTFKFKLEQPLPSYMPGNYIVFDFSGLVEHSYEAMKDQSPQLLNDDFVRTWTISSAVTSLDEVTCTIKLVESGAISPILHSIRPADLQVQALELPVLGVSGDFSCFRRPQVGGGGELACPSKMLWIAGGVGMTPFLAFLEAIVRDPAHATDIVLFFACRGDDVALVWPFAQRLDHARIQVHVFDSAGLAKAHDWPAHWQISHRHMDGQDVMKVDLQARESFICGPDAMITAAADWLNQAGSQPETVHSERFF